MSYKCISCQKEEFSSPARYKDHLKICGAAKWTADELDALVKISKEPMGLKQGIHCPLCRHPLHSVEQYQRHVGRHQEQLALFALKLPRGDIKLDSGAGESDSRKTRHHVAGDKNEDVRSWLGGLQPPPPAHLNKSDFQNKGHGKVSAGEAGRSMPSTWESQY